MTLLRLRFVAFALLSLTACHPPTPVIGFLPTPVPSSIVVALHSESVSIADAGTLEIDRTPYVMVSIAGQPKIPMIFDTGSSGVRVFSSALPSAMNYAVQPYTTVSETFGSTGSGSTLSGYLARADIDLGPGVDLGTQYFQVITNPDSTTGTKMSGIFGVRPDAQGLLAGPNSLLVSPMGYAPAPLNSGFIISLQAQTLTVGLTAASRAPFGTAYIQASPAPYPTAVGSPPSVDLWNTFTYAWNYDVVSPDQTTFTRTIRTFSGDTGGLDMHVYTSATPPAPTNGATPMPSGQFVAFPAGTSITVNYGNITWALPPEGSCDAYNVAYFNFENTGGTRAYPSFGINPFYSNNVMYDLANLRLAYQPIVPAQTPSFCSGA